MLHNTTIGTIEHSVCLLFTETLLDVLDVLQDALQSLRLRPPAYQRCIEPLLLNLGCYGELLQGISLHVRSLTLCTERGFRLIRFCFQFLAKRGHCRSCLVHSFFSSVKGSGAFGLCVSPFKSQAAKQRPHQVLGSLLGLLDCNGLVPRNVVGHCSHRPILIQALSILTGCGACIGKLNLQATQASTDALTQCVQRRWNPMMSPPAADRNNCPRSLHKAHDFLHGIVHPEACYQTLVHAQCSSSGRITFSTCMNLCQQECTPS
mmetsp:Transcript_86721/g.172177  ORF Transcript_86721/g.172177 Transcript_86721/m.172177 type:complete len:263 (+) Transcript_86721:1916-2704(+)